MELDPDERLIRKSTGNFRRESCSTIGWIGGSWWLTSKRLIFESNLTNFESRKISVPLREIDSIGMRHKDFVSSKLTIFISDQPEIELHVKERKKWAADIFELRKAKLPSKFIDDSFITSRVREIRFGDRIKQAALVVVICAVGILISFFLLNVLNK